MRLFGSWRRRVAALGLAVAGAAAGVVAAAPAQAQTGCSDVHVVFARGSTELPGLGITGTPFVNALKSRLPGKTVSSYAVNYAADILQTSAGPGATDMTRNVRSVAQRCPNTKFVLGGYSQGASVTDISIGIRTFLGFGETIPTELAPRIAAIAVFGNPLRLFGQDIPKASQLYGSKAIDICAAGDPVCAGGFNFLAHLSYPIDGSTTRAAEFAASKLR